MFATLPRRELKGGVWVPLTSEMFRLAWLQSKLNYNFRRQLAHDSVCCAPRNDALLNKRNGFLLIVSDHGPQGL